MSLKMLSQQLLERKTLPEQLQHRIFEDAVTTKDHALLEMLAGHTDLHPEVDARFTEVSAARVLRVWLDRDGRDLALVNELAVKERRKTVLTVLAAKEGLSEKAYQAIADRDYIQSSAALVTNGAAPTAARETAIRTVVTAFEAGFRNNSHRDALRRALEGAGPDLAAAAISVTAGDPTVARAVSQHPLDEPTFEELLAKLEPHAVEQAASMRRSSYTHAQEQALATIGEAISAVALNSDLPDGGLERLQRFAVRLQDWTPRAAGAVKVLAEVAAIGDRKDLLIEKAATGNGPEVDDVLEVARKTPIHALKRQLVRGVLDNRNATVEQFQRAGEVDRQVANRHALVAAVRQRDVDKQIAAINLSWQIDPDTIARLTDPVSVSQAQIKANASSAYRARPYLEWMLSSGHGRDIPAVVLTTGNLLSSDGAFERICGPIVSTIASSAEAWQTLSSLVAEFDGTIGELIDTTFALCPEIDVPAAPAEPEPDGDVASDPEQMSLL